MLNADAGHCDAPADDPDSRRPKSKEEPTLHTLTQATLANLPSAIPVPRYDRSALRVGIVHFGLGNFHRVHQALYLDRCLHASGAGQWGICGVELIDTPATRAKAAAYKAQDCLYTVTELSPDGTAATRVIGSMIDYLHAPADPDAVLARLSHADTKIVSLTITEGGYNIDEVSGAFNLSAPDVARDLTGGTPRTVFGFIVEALRLRREAGTPPFTVMSCDNLRHNGETARLAVVSYARARDPTLAAFIDNAVAFPNSMVDRIAPQVPEPVRVQLNERSGIDDAVPAMAESFIQWVVEDRFTAGRPRLEDVGVEIRDDVATYEFMKMRILNACHMMLAYPGLLCGYGTVHEALGDARLFRLLDTFVDRDVIPSLEAPAGISLPAYKAAVLDRFSNPAIGDRLLRIAHDGASKIPVFHARTIESLLAGGGDLRREAFFLACFGRYMTGRGDGAAAIEVAEPKLTSEDRALLAGGDPAGLLQTSPFAKLGLASHAAFRTAYLGYAASLDQDGCSRTLDGLLKDGN